MLPCTWITGKAEDFSAAALPVRRVNDGIVIAIIPQIEEKTILTCIMEEDLIHVARASGVGFQVDDRP